MQLNRVFEVSDERAQELSIGMSKFLDEVHGAADMKKAMSKIRALAKTENELLWIMAIGFGAILMTPQKMAEEMLKHELEKEGEKKVKGAP